ncbi:MAG TPA: VOC family protein [Propionibacteriaceae bacterium]|jgi:catechol 2,3-dioxygenase-like lactoylglutathione lyase family enzyme
MTERPTMRLTGVVLDSPDAQALAGFYRDLLGWETASDEPGWVMLKAPGGGAGLSFQTEAQYVRPTWPSEPGQQQMLVHLDIEVDDLERAEAHAVSVGAALADYQPQEDVRVCLDPDGHPFCLYAPD